MISAEILGLGEHDIRWRNVEPCIEGFEHVVDAADEATVPIFRHVRYEAHNAPTNHTNRPRKGRNGRTAIGAGERDNSRARDEVPSSLAVAA